MRMFSFPISVATGSVPHELQSEFIDLQCDSAVKCKFLENPKLTFFFFSKYMTEVKYTGICKHTLFTSSALPIYYASRSDTYMNMAFGNDNQLNTHKHHMDYGR